ncbi:DNA methyltransferase [Bacillus sp. SCS-153A]|uniref:DNA methyltransferase n=1 Tax=Rossellomorea sedimentorum TaxID=3115294 RepID=UPI003906265A
MNKKERLETFVDWFKTNCEGDEKGEAQIYLDRLFQGFGHDGVLEVGGKAEFRIRKKKGTSFADLVWKPVVLIEMKKRGTDLSKHYSQAEEYWMNLVPDRPKYVVLCNFDEFWIFDLNRQLEDPIDKVLVTDLPKKWGPLAFLFPSNEAEEPVFENDLIEVTASAADNVAGMYKSLINRGIDRDDAQVFSLQCVLSMFAEDIELLPRYMFTRLIKECLEGQSSYDLIGDLFMRMNQPGNVPHGKYKNVDYFNGGLFSKIVPIQLNQEELEYLHEAAKHDWSKVKPAIFGVLFEDSMEKEKRHAFGAHFTSEADIMKIVRPSIVHPWEKKISKANTIKELYLLLEELRNYKVLDPACGSGNFLYVAFIQLKKLEKSIYEKIRSLRKKNKNIAYSEISFISAKQFYGMDVNKFATELAKVTLMIAKKLAYDEFHIDETILPLDNLDKNILCQDALFNDWPEADVIIGNPPFQSKNKIQQELGVKYVSELRKTMPQVPGHADYCVYWFRKAHDVSKKNGRIGLVGTNTIRENYSRIGGLDYVIQNGGTITEAVSSQPWSGDAVVHVSIVNWLKGSENGKKKLFMENQGSVELDFIPSYLTAEFDVTKASVLSSNLKAKCYQGQTHGHAGFILSKEERDLLISKNDRNKNVIFPYLIANDLFGNLMGKPQRYVIDFYPRTIIESKSYKEPFKRVQETVLPTREANFKEEVLRNKEVLDTNPKARVNRHHAGFYDKWWLHSYPRGDMLNSISKLSRYVVCSQHSKRPIFEFVDSEIRPNASIMVFPFEDDYSYGVLQSIYHWSWFKAKGSKIKDDFRYTATTIFNTFPWPQNPDKNAVQKVAEAAKNLREFRIKIMKENDITLRELYRSLELPGKNNLYILHLKLDVAVREAYNFTKRDPLINLLTLNIQLSEKERLKEEITGPGFPLEGIDDYISDDCIKI